MTEYGKYANIISEKYTIKGGIGMDVFGRIEIIKAYVLKEFLVKNIDKLDITDILTNMGLKRDYSFHHNLEIKNGIASFFSIHEEIANLVDLYDLSKSYKKMEDTNKTYLEIVSIYQKKLNGPVNIEIFGKIKPYMQLKNLILLGEISMNANGFVVFDDKEYKVIIENVVKDYRSNHEKELATVLKTWHSVSPNAIQIIPLLGFSSQVFFEGVHLIISRFLIRPAGLLS